MLVVRQGPTRSAGLEVLPALQTRVRDGTMRVSAHAKPITDKGA